MQTRDTDSDDLPIERALTSQDRLSYLFTLRIWKESLGEGQSEWRGKIEHISHPQVAYFRDWQSLVQHLQMMLEDAEFADEKVNKVKHSPKSGGSHTF